MKKFKGYRKNQLERAVKINSLTGLIDFYKIKHDHLWRVITEDLHECKFCGLKMILEWNTDTRGKYYKKHYQNPDPPQAKEQDSCAASVQEQPKK